MAVLLGSSEMMWVGKAEGTKLPGLVPVVCFALLCTTSMVCLEKALGSTGGTVDGTVIIGLSLVALFGTALGCFKNCWLRYNVLLSMDYYHLLCCFTWHSTSCLFMSNGCTACWGCLKVIVGSEKHTTKYCQWIMCESFAS